MGRMDKRHAARLLVGGMVASAILAGPAALAATVTNRDTAQHKLTILSGASPDVRTLKPGEAARDICPKGCIVRLGDSREGEYEIEGQDTVSIENGSLYYDGPPDQGAARTPVSPVPSLKPSR